MGSTFTEINMTGDDLNQKLSVWCPRCMDNDKQNFNVDEIQGFKMHESLADAFDVGIMPYEWDCHEHTMFNGSGVCHIKSILLELIN